MEQDWRRPVAGTDHGRSWAGVVLGAIVTFLVMELPALGGKAGDTLSEAVWSVTRPFGPGWWAVMPPLAGLLAWLWPHLALRWGGVLELAACVAGAYVACLALWAITG